VKKILRPIPTVIATCFICACGTPGARDFGGRWKPVNHFDEKSVEIPLAPPYTYAVTPMDGTLKTLLTRWTRDAGLKLSYRLRSDFSLTRSASALRTTELRDAAAQLTTAYTAQRVVVSVIGDEIVVGEATTSPIPSQMTPDGSANDIGAAR